MTTRLLVVGHQSWTDGDRVRKLLHWALNKYGQEGATIVTCGSESGAEVIALRAWRELPDVNPEPEFHRPDFDTYGYEAWKIRDHYLIEQCNLTAVLAFPLSPSDKARKLVRLAKKADVPAWRWSQTLNRAVVAGRDSHSGRYRPGRYFHDPMYDH